MEAGDLTIYQEADQLPPLLPALGELFTQARASGQIVAAVAHGSDPQALWLLAKRRHDVQGALRTLAFTVEALESGYTFQDDRAPAKIDAVAKAVKVLRREAEILTRLLGSEAGSVPQKP